MNTVEQNLELAVKKFEEHNQDNETVTELKKALDEYNQLLKKGLAESRGNRLKPLGELHLRKFAFNCSTQ